MHFLESGDRHHGMSNGADGAVRGDHLRRRRLFSGGAGSRLHRTWDATNWTLRRRRARAKGHGNPAGFSGHLRSRTKLQRTRCRGATRILERNGSRFVSQHTALPDTREPAYLREQPSAERSPCIPAHLLQSAIKPNSGNRHCSALSSRWMGSMETRTYSGRTEFHFCFSQEHEHRVAHLVHEPAETRQLLVADGKDIPCRSSPSNSGCRWRVGIVFRVGDAGRQPLLKYMKTVTMEDLR